jgi:hypothetical protein
MHSLTFPGLRLARGASHLVVREAPKAKQATKKPAAKRKPRVPKKAVNPSVVQTDVASQGSTAISAVPTEYTRQSQAIINEHDLGSFDEMDDSVPFEALSSTPPTQTQVVQHERTRVREHMPAIRISNTHERVIPEPSEQNEEVGPMRFFDMEQINANS